MSVAPPQDAEPRPGGSTGSSEPPAPEPDSTSARGERPSRTRRHGGSGGDGAPDRRQRQVTWAVGSFTLIALLALAALVWTGLDASRHLTSDNEVDYVTDPDAPGFAAEVAPTPVHLVALLREDGSLGSAWLLSQSRGDDGGGAILTIPVSLTVETGFGTKLFSDAAGGGIEVLRTTAETIVGFSIPEGEATALDMAGLADLVAPVAPLTIENPDPIRGEDGEVAFEAGTLELSAEEVGEYLLAKDPSELDTNRERRAELVWEAWLDAVGRSGDPEAVPGEGDAGLSGFLRVLATGERDLLTVDYQVLPVPGIEPPSAILVPDQEALASTVAVAVPYPASAYPGQRVRVRLLNGTDDTSALTVMAQVLVPLNGEISRSGNAASFDLAETVVQYHDEAFAEQAEDFARELSDALGGDVELEVELSAEALDVVDLTIVVGRDVLG